MQTTNKQSLKILFVEKFSETNPEGFIDYFVKQGHKVSANIENPDIIFCASFFKTREAMNLKIQFPNAKLIVYCWDYYKWVHEGKHDANWGQYRELMKMADTVIVPSDGQKLRLKELLDIDSIVCETSIPYYDHEVRDDRFVLDPVRHYPEENRGWVEKACEELGIPCDHSEHKYSLEEFRDKVNSCSFMVCAFREASTGGLSLMEGLYNGKVSLVSNSPYMGAKNYIGDYGYYFQYDDFEDLKRKIKYLWDNPELCKLDKKDTRDYMRYFSDEAFGARLIKIFKNENIERN